MLSNRYAILKEKLFQDNNNLEQIVVCANTRLDPSFIDKFLLSKNNLYRRLNIVLSIIVQDIVNKKIVDKQIYLSIYIIDANNVILEARLYIIKNIKIDIILDNNVLRMS